MHRDYREYRGYREGAAQIRERRIFYIPTHPPLITGLRPEKFHPSLAGEGVSEADGWDD